jgi:hypothetical protein
MNRRARRALVLVAEDKNVARSSAADSASEVEAKIDGDFEHNGKWYKIAKHDDGTEIDKAVGGCQLQSTDIYCFVCMSIQDAAYLIRCSKWEAHQNSHKHTKRLEEIAKAKAN